MPGTTGHRTLEDLQEIRDQSIVEFGLDTIADIVLRDVEVHNEIVEDMLDPLAEIDTDQLRRYGSSVEGEMVEVDEHGRGPTQKDVQGATVGFPLRNFQFAVGWTDKWFRVNTPADMAEQVNQAEKADLQRIQRQIKRAVFRSSNYTFFDYLGDQVDLDVKRLVNADGEPIPDGPNAETFDGATHTHYLAVDGLTQTAARNLIQTVVEHGHGEQVRVFINRADQGDWEGLADFEKYRDPRMVFRQTDTPGETLDLTRLDNRAIGIFDAAEVWVKPWIPASYALCVDVGSPQKPLMIRQRDAESLQGLRVASEIDAYPLHTEYMEREIGVGVWTRTNGAVLYSGGAAYTDPSV